MYAPWKCTDLLRLLPVLVFLALAGTNPVQAQVAAEHTSPAGNRILWEKSYRLKKSDFKGSIINRPNEAETVGSIQYSGDPSPHSGLAVIKIETVFDCRESYFVGESDTSFTLQHEQGHFDLSEIHARKFVKAIREEVRDYHEFELRHRALFDDIDHQLQLHHATYDQDIYASHAKQLAWLGYIRREMAALEAYADKRIVLPLKLNEK